MCGLQDGGVLLVATTRENLSPSLVLELLRRIGGIIKVRPATVELPAGLSATFLAEHEGRIMLQVLRVRAPLDLLMGCLQFSRPLRLSGMPAMPAKGSFLFQMLAVRALPPLPESAPTTAHGCAQFSRVCRTHP